MTAAVIQAVISGIIGGAVAGVAALAAVHVKIDWLRRDVDFLLKRVE